MPLYLDLDGVFADFDGQLRNYGVIKNDQTFHHTHPSTWTDAQIDLSNKVEKCMSMPGFWEEIPLMDRAYELWDYCEPFKPIILTAIPNKEDWFEQIKDEKQRWIDKYLGFKTRVVYCLRSEKAQRANTVTDILVDDTTQNILEWNNAGGTGILHTDVSDTIKKLAFTFEEIY